MPAPDLDPEVVLGYRRAIHSVMESMIATMRKDLDLKVVLATLASAVAEAVDKAAWAENHIPEKTRQWFAGVVARTPGPGKVGYDGS